ncbi:MAG: protein kinase, partial [Anaerolineaceae bacterium]
MDDLSGQEIRGYKLIERIGEGGFGVVYRAEQPAVDREVAIKVILPEYTDHPEFVQRFEAEARMVAKLEHPHIVPLYDYWRDEEGAFLVMRWLRGGNLREALEDGPCDPKTAGQLLEQITEALNMAHKQGVIHRDLKPENILLDDEGNAYLTDFGIAKDLGGEGLTQSGKIVGSVDYLAPEQAKGEEVTPRTDIYGLGVLLYEMLTGEHPFPSLTPVQMLQKHLNESLPAVHISRPELPPELDDMIQIATAKDPESRYTTARDFKGAYDRVWAFERVTPETHIAAQLPTFLRDEVDGRDVERPVFVARNQEISRLDAFLEMVLTGKGKVVFVTGGAGRGKTALIDEFCRRAQATYDDLIISNGNCNAHTGIADPYLPFRDVMAMLTGDVESKWSAGTITRDHAEQLWHTLPQTVDAILDCGASLIDVFVPGEALSTRARMATPDDLNRLRRIKELVDRKKTGTSELEQSLLFEQFTNVIQTLARTHPLILVLDDVQWADHASLDLLFHLGRRIEGCPILVLSAYRPDEVALGRGGERHPLEGVVNELKRIYGDVVVDLSQEEEIQGSEFIEAFLDTEPNRLSPEFRRALKSHTGGHPLFTIELLRAMQERGDLIRDEDGMWVEGPNLVWDQLPARVEAVIEERLSRLEGDLRELLSVASVEGEDFTAQVVARVQEIKERRLLRELSQELEKRHRLIREKGVLQIDDHLLSRYRFVHHLYQRYLYNDLGDGERRLLHREIAEVLEELFGDTADKYAVQLAFHYDQAGVKEKALHYLMQAGHQTREKYANAEGIQHYTKALALMPDDHPDRFDLLHSRAKVFRLVGRREEQRADVEGLLDLAEMLNDNALRCDALIAQADYFLDTEIIFTKEPAERAMGIARDMGDKVREAHALHRFGVWAWHREEHLKSQVALESAFELLQEAGLIGEAATCLLDLTMIFVRLGEHDAALGTAEKAVALSREVGDTRQEATGLRRLAISFWYLQRYAEAFPIAQQALVLHRELGDRGEEVNALNVLGILYAWLKDPEEAETYLRESLELAWSIGDNFGIRAALVNLFEYHYLPSGEYEQWMKFLETQLEEAKASEDELLIGYIELWKVQILSDYGQTKQAMDLLKDLIQSMEKIASKLELVNNYALLSQLQAELGDFRGARQSFKTSLQLSNETGREIMEVYRRYDSAYISLLEGNRERMLIDLDQLLEGLDRIRETNDNVDIVERLNLAARICLVLGQIEKALECSSEAIEIMSIIPNFHDPEVTFFTHATALYGLGRENEARGYLQQAFDRVMLVANNTKDEKLRRSWLENVK